MDDERRRAMLDALREVNFKNAAEDRQEVIDFLIFVVAAGGLALLLFGL